MSIVGSDGDVGGEASDAALSKASGGGSGGTGVPGGGGGDDGFSFPSFDFGWDDVLGLPGVGDAAKRLLQKPRATVIGIIVTAGLEAIFGAVTWVIGGIQVFFRGTEPGVIPQEGETLGLADTLVSPFLWLRDNTSGVFADFGTGVVGFNDMVAGGLVDAVGLGPARPVVFVGLFAIETYAAWKISTRLVLAVMDAIPVLSGVQTFLFR